MIGELLTEWRGHVLVLTLSNPSKRNALDPALCNALAEAVRGMADQEVRCAVLTGEGDKAFCSGFDITALPSQSNLQDIGANPFDPLIDAVAASPVPIVAALNGGAFGGGCELAAACDLRIGHAGVVLAIPPAKLGIVYAARGLARLSALVGESRAREMFLAARSLEAQEAAQWGLIDYIVEPDQVLPRALQMAERIAELAPLAVQGMRRTFEALMRQRATLDPDTAAEIDRLRLAAFTSADGAEARAAFVEKRKPRFTGK